MLVKLGNLVIETEDIRAMQEYTSKTWYGKTEEHRKVLTNTVGQFELDEEDYEALLCVMRPRVIEIVND